MTIPATEEKPVSDQPATYTAKPREVDALRIDRDNLDAVQEWAQVRIEPKKLPGPGRGMHEGVLVRHLDGHMTAEFGDYLTRDPIRVHSAAAFEEAFEQS